MSPTTATAATVSTSPACVIGGFQAMLAATRSVDRLTETFRTGEGLGWHEHHHDLFKGTERFFRPGYIANLASSWILLSPRVGRDPSPTPRQEGMPGDWHGFPGDDGTGSLFFWPQVPQPARTCK